MKFFSLLALACTASVAFAAKSSPEPFEHYQSLAGTRSLDLNDDLYEELTGAPRDFHVAVLLTTLEARYGCELCQVFQPEWELVARSWAKGSQSTDIKLLLGTLEFKNGRRIFQKLQLKTAPVALLFPPTIGPHAKNNGVPYRFEFTSVANAQQFYDWLNRHLPDGPKPPLIKQINYARIASVITLLMGLVTVATVASPYVMPIIQNRKLWAAASLIAILLFISGQMFNQIRQMPYVAGNGRGGISYFARGFSSQFGLETQIIAALYGSLAFSTITLALKVPRIQDPKVQQFAVLVCGATLFALYSFLLSVFRMKNGAYPFYLPPF
ncbi:hypothetical protein VTN49DRAFT_3339 [Thermomyces lanuginosus]|uniref:uncharacterized protein n=1 Tax=Thermomyces lanuginosus TaxID=5541 RepID=UPI0037445F19